MILDNAKCIEIEFFGRLAKIAYLSMKQCALVSESDEFTRQQERDLARRGIGRSNDRSLELDNREEKSSDEEQTTIFDVLGRYFPATRQIVLYTKVIDFCAQSLHVPNWILREVVLAHEIAHAVTHFGAEAYGTIWDNFADASTEDKELLAQLLPYDFFKREGKTEHLEVMETLSLRQSPKYNAYKQQDALLIAIPELVRELRRKVAQPKLQANTSGSVPSTSVNTGQIYPSAYGSDETTFIGIDLAWQSNKNHSGVVVGRGSNHGMKLTYCSEGLKTLQSVVDCIAEYTTENTVIAIDAPLIIANQSHPRPCEILIGEKFGRFDAQAHSTNLGRYPNADSVKLARLLKMQGFTHQPDPATDRLKAGKWFFEVYPHPAQVVLFSLNKILKYKAKSGRKGKPGRTIAERKVELRKLRDYIRNDLALASPGLQGGLSFELLNCDVSKLRGVELKQYEDSLDACFCAYLACFYWTWGDQKNEMIGDLQKGYIINPTTP